MNDITSPTTGQKIKTWAKRILTLMIILPILGFSGYVLFTLKYVYAKGERAGYLQKFSKKGWLFKTWEGELAMVNLPGAMPEIFYFTVRDDKAAEKVSSLLGQRVNIYYDQHRGIPGTWYGDTQYFVRDVQMIADRTPQSLQNPAGNPPPPTTK